MSSGSQQSLFGDELPPWVEDEGAERLVATVVFIAGPTQEFDYAVPDKLRGALTEGCRVRVPLGRGDRLQIGYCVRLASRVGSTRRLKEVRGLVDAARLLSPAMLRLTEWIAEHYVCPWGQVLETVIPAGVKAQAGTREVVLLSLAKGVRPQLATLKLTAKQREIVDHLAAASQPLTIGQLAQVADCHEGSIATLRKRGIIDSVVERRRQGNHAAPAMPHEEHLVLNPDQRLALTSILATLASGKHETLLLHGVTGSGKTEIYIHAVDEVRRYGRQSIVLVPEISLTPQTQQRFRARFGDVAVLHSHLSDSERHYHWERIARGEVSVIVGARSAIFAPAPHLGLIVLDEEHEGSFKNGNPPRYHARDVALQRAQAENIPLVLGSATPSLESWQRAKEGQYRLLSLPRRVLDRPLPIVRTIDLRNELRGRSGSLSRPLTLAMRQALADDGQVILLLNRRGFSTHMQCPSCGLVMRCPSCEIALTHHHQKEIALCHYCEYEIPAPLKCPQCLTPGIRYSGAGTQRLEAEVRSNFPNYACLRMDTDAMQKPGSHEKALAAFRSGEAKILLGTQMIAKGLDFPNVTLVGVINADLALHLPDFRAAERTMQLLVQVAGRGGRGAKEGQVLVQTFSPEHPAIVAAVRHDFIGFAGLELPMRQALGYPPFGNMVRLVVRGPKQEATSQFAEHLAGVLKRHLEDVQAAARALGPAPAPLAKLRDNFRFQIQLQGADADLLRQALRRTQAEVQPPEDIQWMADIDPIEML